MAGERTHQTMCETVWNDTSTEGEHHLCRAAMMKETNRTKSVTTTTTITNPTIAHTSNTNATTTSTSPTDSGCTKTIQVCNHRAIELLFIDQYDAAIDVWQYAISKLRRSLKQTPNIIITNHAVWETIIDNNNMSGVVSSVVCFSSGLVKPIDDLDCLTSSISHGLFQLYNRPFTFRTKMHTAAEAVSSLSPDLEQKIWSAILLYNLGLAYHLQCIQSQRNENVAVNIPSSTSNTSALLSRALKFYELSLCLLDSMDEHFIHPCEIGKLLLAVVNNMGCIHSSFYNHQEMMHCRDLILVYFPEIISSSPSLLLRSNTPPSLSIMSLADDENADSSHHDVVAEASHLRPTLVFEEPSDFVTFFSFSVLLLHQCLNAAPSA
jgi:hypothetical protein